MCIFANYYKMLIIARYDNSLIDTKKKCHIFLPLGIIKKNNNYIQYLQTSLNILNSQN